MAKKHKNKIGKKDNEGGHQSSSAAAVASSEDDPVYTCLELVAKPPPKRTSEDDSNKIDDKYVVLNSSDAYKMDIHDGEPALLASSLLSSSPGSPGSRNDTPVAVVCKVRISSPDSSKSGTPITSKKRSSVEAASAGEIIIASSSLYGCVAQMQSNVVIARGAITPPPPPALAAPSPAFTSPSKSGFSFSKGGGGDALISPSPSKYTSPSGSKFSFSKGGGGDTLLSPGQAKPATPNIPYNKRTPSTVLVMPLLGLTPQQRHKVCPDAQTVAIYPINRLDESRKSTLLLSSIKIIQTLILSKYKGAFVQAQSAESNSGDRKDFAPETISISFRGHPETFRIISVAKVPFRDTQAVQSKNVSDLSNAFEQLDVSADTTKREPESLLQKENALLKFVQAQSALAYRITSRTKIEFAPFASRTTQIPVHDVKSPQKLCAGLDSTFARIKDTLLPPLLHPDLFPKDGPLRPPKGALLFGPAGVGKSLLAAQITNDLSFASGRADVHIRLVQCADILSSAAIIGEAEKKLTDVFAEVESKAKGSGGSLLILDDVHLICPRRGGMGGSGGLGVDQLAGTLLALLDGIGSSQVSDTLGGSLVVLAITTEPSLLDPALRRPGRLDVEIEVPVPDDEARADIFSFHLSQIMAKEQIDDDGIRALARLAKGFTGADCKLAVKEAVRTSISRALRLGIQSKQTATDVQYADLEHAIRITKPSAIKSVAVEVPKVPWSAIGGMNDVKALLKESIELPLTHPHLFEMMQVPPPKGILLYGPPGCSKTLMARAIATEGNMNFLAVKGPELLSKWLGESERALASLFRRARLAAPAVIFFDEMDAIASKRGASGGGGGDRLLSQLLTELDGVTTGGSAGVKSGRVVVVGATNRPDVLDAALTRPGRMDRMIYVGLPDEQGRESIFKIGLSGKDCNEDVDVSLQQTTRCTCLCLQCLTF